MVTSRLDKRVAADFSRALVRAYLRYLLALLFGKTNRLLSFDEVQRGWRLREQVYLGVCTVEVAKIRGCVNRCADFDQSFLPTRTSLADRWKSVDRAHYTAVQLLPPILLEESDTYYVYDGYNRVSVARFHGN